MTRASIIIPVRNDPERLGKLLASFSEQDWTDHEVLVVDDGSTDDTAAVASDYPLHLIPNDGPPGPSGARNLGAQAASEKVFLFLDSDVVLEPNAIARVMTWFDDPQVVGVSTIASEVPQNPGFVPRYSAVSDRYIAETWDPPSSASEAKNGVWKCRWFSTRFGAIRKQPFHDVGGFDVRFDHPCIEDAEFSIRLARKYSLILDPDAAHSHHWPTGILQVLRKTFRNSRLLMKVLREQNSAAPDTVRRSERVARVLCGLAVLLVFSAPFSTIGAIASVAILATSAWLYRGLFRAYHRSGGTMFMLGSILLHYLVTCAGLAGAATAAVSSPRSSRARQEHR
jgi:glycosyltransferase involved in cell wall biosynthesis